MKKLLFILFTSVAWSTFAAPKEVVTHIGYVYPAGAQVGQTLQVTVGGKGLKQAKEVLISGKGVEAKVVGHIKNYKRRLQEHVQFLRKEKLGKGKMKKERRFGTPPEHPYFDQWLHYSEAEFRQMQAKFFKKEKVQRNNEIDELVVLEITVSPEAKPGLRELYLKSTRSVSNPIRFRVDNLPEVYEQEPNDKSEEVKELLSLPFVVNGQVQPGDTDHFRFSAEKGQKLVIQTRARELIPYLADAVPGWFQAVLSLKDSKGNEVAFADDYRFNPDPVLFYEVEKSGEYSLSIHDSIFRGREDFVYRISVGELPFVTGIYPLGGQKNQPTQVSLQGWNLPYDTVRLNTNGSASRQVSGTLKRKNWVSNTIKYALSDEPELLESKRDNNSLNTAQKIRWPVVINGKIEQSGDTDFYHFQAKKGDRLHAEVIARRLHSPMDPLIRLYGPDLELISWKDDAQVVANTGMLTHHADPELLHTIEKSGTYYLQVADTQFQGGDAFSYRVQLNQQKPEFELYVTPSAIHLRPGGTALVKAHVVRKNGFTGPVTVGLYEAPTQLELTGNQIPAGQSSATFVLRAPRKAQKSDYSLAFVGVAKVQGKKLIKAATPADQKTQAFITPHLVEAQQSHLVIGGKKQYIAHVKPTSPQILLLKSGESRLKEFKASLGRKQKLHFALKNAPEGIRMKAERDGRKVTLNFDVSDEVKPGQQGNLIVEVYAEVSPKNKKNKKSKKPVEYSLGYLPAIPFEVI